MQRIRHTNAWPKLDQQAALVRRQHMRDWFENDPSRGQKMQLESCGIFLDYSKNRVNDEVLASLFELARERQVEDKVKAMFAGETINFTEGRAVLHTALRNFSGKPVQVDGKDVMPEVLATLDKMQAFTHSIHSGEHKGHTGKRIDTVVSIGIGGSFLGPKIVTEALKPYQVHSVDVRFVANVDGCHMHDVLSHSNPETTLFVMSSKSFSTQETLQNTLTAKDWFLQQGGSQQDIAKHFVAVSSNIPACLEFGIAEKNIFPMADWVGGRYSLWSAIGLPICLSLGFDNFRALLEGAYDMDLHVQTAPLEKNMPALLAMLGIWYRNFLGAQSHVLLPYYHYLRGFPAYVQQLDMESNGKSATADGHMVDHGTGPIIWGSEGTNGQHSFHQLIHQSNLPIPADFMLPLKVANQNQVHHDMLASNCFGQTQAMMQGKTYEQCYADLEGQSLSDEARHVLASHKTMPGNKPSNTLLFEQLDPKTLGSLIALYEHKVLIQGAVWDLNSFDQWGVELGKVLGNQVLASIQSDDDNTNVDSSTASLIQRYKQAQ